MRRVRTRRLAGVVGAAAFALLAVLGSASATQAQDTAEVCDLVLERYIAGETEEAKALNAVLPKGTCADYISLKATKDHLVKELTGLDSCEAANALGGPECSDPEVTDTLLELERTVPYLLTLAVAYYIALWVGPLQFLAGIAQREDVALVAGLVALGLTIPVAATVGLVPGAAATALVVFVILRYFANQRDIAKAQSIRFSWLALAAAATITLLAAAPTLLGDEQEGWWLLAIAVLAAPVFAAFSMAAHGARPRLKVEAWSEDEDAKAIATAVLAEIRFQASNETGGMMVSKPESTEEVQLPDAVSSAGGVATKAAVALLDALRPRRTYVLHVDGVQSTDGNYRLLASLRRGWVHVESRSYKVDEFGDVAKMRHDAPDLDQQKAHTQGVIVSAMATWTLWQMERHRTGTRPTMYHCQNLLSAELTSTAARLYEFGYENAARHNNHEAIQHDSTNLTAQYNLGLIELWLSPTIPDSASDPERKIPRRLLTEAQRRLQEVESTLIQRVGTGNGWPLWLRANYNRAVAVLNEVADHKTPRPEHPEKLETASADVSEAISTLDDRYEVPMSEEDRRFVDAMRPHLEVIRAALAVELNESDQPPEQCDDPRLLYARACVRARESGSRSKALDDLQQAVTLAPKDAIYARVDPCFFTLRRHPDSARTFDRHTLPDDKSVGMIHALAPTVTKALTATGMDKWSKLGALAGNTAALQKLADNSKLDVVMLSRAANTAALAEKVTFVRPNETDPESLGIHRANLLAAAGFWTATDVAKKSATEFQKLAEKANGHDGEVLRPGSTGKFASYKAVEPILKLIHQSCAADANRAPVDGEVVILSLVPDPIGAGSNRELITLYNGTAADVNLAGWTLSTNTGSTHTLSGRLRAGTTRDIRSTGLFQSQADTVVTLHDRNGGEKDQVMFAAGKRQTGKFLVFELG